METLIYLLKFCISSLLVFMTGFLAWWYYKEWVKIKIARENEYDEKYKEISDGIKFCTVNPDTYKYLLDELNKLKNLKYKNPEKTKVLRDSFYWKYRSITQQRANKPTPEAAFKS